MQKHETTAIFSVTLPPIFDQRDIREGLSCGGGHRAMIPPSLEQAHISNSCTTSLFPIFIADHDKDFTIGENIVIYSAGQVI
jgi:hypothetical protein